ncbi:MAG: hypothetical protein OEZ02_12815 [Anaerolineae bacterium]|nr:hypothetical protein [Anaerolineae bacterium]
MAAKTIILKGDPLQKERQAVTAAITPGMLIELASASEVRPHANAGQNASPVFALENAMIGDDIDHSYLVGENVVYAFFRAGDEVNALLADTQNVAAGDLLESDGAGALQKHTPPAVNEGGVANYSLYYRAPVCRALEALNNISGSPARIKVEVL